jgi:hypothetical protein
MPRKCVNHPDSFCYVCGDFTFKVQGRSLTALIKNVMNFTLRVKSGIKIRSGPLFLLLYLCETSGGLD